MTSQKIAPFLNFSSLFQISHRHTYTTSTSIYLCQTYLFTEISQQQTRKNEDKNEGSGF